MAWIIPKGAFGDLRQRALERWVEELADHVSDDVAAHLRSMSPVGGQGLNAALQRLRAFPPRIVLSRAWWGQPLRRVLARLLPSFLGRRAGAANAELFLFGNDPLRLVVQSPPGGPGSRPPCGVIG